MSSNLILISVIAYSALLFFVVWLTSRKANNESYFVGNRSSRWYVVAYGMIGASLSGVTFMSVPGWVGTTQFSYMVVVFGYLAGYFVIANILLPLYYKLNLTSIYTYLDSRFGRWSYITGSSYFIISRTIGAAFRMFIVVNVLQTFVFDQWNVPFYATTVTFILLILLYTYEGGVKTIVWTDTLQTTFMLLALVLAVIIISGRLNISLADLPNEIFKSKYSTLIQTDWKAKTFFLKQFFGGMFIAIAMTGLDQEMMQKNISCKNIGEAKKNMITFSFVLVLVNLLFLFLGVLLYKFADGVIDITALRTTDDLFPTVALNYLGTFSALLFVIGLISAAYPSADGALTALTAAFCIDIVGMKRRNFSEEKQKRLRYGVHISFAAVLLGVIVIFRIINDDAVISKLFTVATYTYGPLLGLYSFGLFTKRKINDSLWVPLICLLSPALCWLLVENSKTLFSGYVFGFELLIVNGVITFLGLLLLSKRELKN